jgi:hypothetical protein
MWRYVSTVYGIGSRLLTYSLAGWLARCPEGGEERWMERDGSTYGVRNGVSMGEVKGNEGELVRRGY